MRAEVRAEVREVSEVRACGSVCVRGRIVHSCAAASEATSSSAVAVAAATAARDDIGCMVGKLESFVKSKMVVFCAWLSELHAASRVHAHCGGGGGL